MFTHGLLVDLDTQTRSRTRPNDAAFLVHDKSFAHYIASPRDVEQPAALVQASRPTVLR